MSKQGNNRTTDTTTETAANTVNEPKQKPNTRQSGAIGTPKKRRGQTKLSPAQQTAFSKAARAFSAMQRELPALTSPTKKPKVDSTLTDKDKLRSPSPAPRNNKSPTSTDTTATVSHKPEETSEHDSQEEEPTPSPMDDLVNAVVKKLNTLRDVQPPPGGPSTGDDAGQKKHPLVTEQDISDRAPIRHYIKEAKLPLHLMLSPSDGLNILRVIRYLHAIHRAKSPASPSSTDSQKIDMLLEGSTLANELHPHLPPTPNHTWYDYVDAIVKQRCTLFKGNVEKAVRQTLETRARTNVGTQDQYIAHRHDVLSFIAAYKWLRSDVLHKPMDESDLQDMEIDMAVKSLPTDMEVAARTMINQNPEPPHTWNCIMTLVQSALADKAASDYPGNDRPTQKHPSNHNFGAASQSVSRNRQRVPLRHPYSALSTPNVNRDNDDSHTRRHGDDRDCYYRSEDYRVTRATESEARQQRGDRDRDYRSVSWRY
jgi:hypothetical protein